MSTTQIPLAQLRLSPKNARKTAGSIDDMAASILAIGLRQNLTVERVNGHHEVVAGGRRLQALQKLLERGQLPAELVDGVPCMVVEAGDAAEISLHENIVRQAMHPADEFDAFHALATADKLAPAAIAERFGTSAKHVEQRLRLANVSPEVLADYRAGKATLEQMMALAIVDDHSRQAKVWKSAGNNTWSSRPEQLRAALIEKEVTTERGAGKFVGADAYELAGGTPRRDLFSDLVTLPDARLVNTLAKARLEGEAGKVHAKGWGWVEARVEFPYHERYDFKQQHGAKPSDKLGAIVTINQDGSLEIVTGLVKPGSKAPVQQKKPQVGGAVKASDRETVEQLRGIATGLLRRHLRANERQARAALAATLADSLLGLNLREPVMSAVPIMAEPQWGSLAAAVKLADPEGERELADLKKLLLAGAKAAGSLFAHMVKLDANTVEAMILELTAAAADGAGQMSGEPDDARKFAAAIGLDLAAGWMPTAAWLEKQPRTWVLAQIVEAAGKDTDKPLAKLKGKEFAEKSLALLQAAKWVPEQLRPITPPKPKPAPKPAKKAAAKAKPAAKKAVKKVAKKAAKRGAK